MKGKIILVTGYCATDKTTFSHTLSKELGITCYNKDTINTFVKVGVEIFSKLVKKLS